ncbi:ABC transporter permease [Occultella aeris]|uniref:Glutathione transport system permease protein GsiC n=1 Tax=Occultella aeris TaxID=2761496 RepID=A0A7M4DNK2_9MICO|nr:ABC transporter permease [Occultella aeris]VZO39033.1 Glutathione transport system permease protein GsiC [Occultella aeris]
MTAVATPAVQAQAGEVLAPLDEVADLAPHSPARGVLIALGKGLAIAVPVLFLTTLITFALGAFSDQDPAAAVLGEVATPADVERMRHEFGLDRPFYEQYGSWVWNALHGDLGSSWFTNIPVADSIVERLPVSLSVAGLALAIALVLGASGGIVAALNRGRFVDRAITAVSAAITTVPAFVAGIGLIIVFAVLIPVFPTGGYVPVSAGIGLWASFLVLPAFALGLDASADLARQLRTGLVGSLDENYVLGAQVRGLPWRRVVLVHALRNGAAPAIAVVGLHIPRLVGGAVITEAVFQMPGIGQLTRDAALRGDVPVIQGALLVAVLLVLVSSLVVNVVLARLLPASGRAA